VWPIWSGSTTTPISFAPLAKKAAGHHRNTHERGHHGGARGHTGLAVLHALIVDFLNHRTGRLDPSYAAIAAEIGVCVRTVATALRRLRELGILNRVRRCAESWADGRFVLEQETKPRARHTHDPDDSTSRRAATAARSAGRRERGRCPPSPGMSGPPAEAVRTQRACTDYAVSRNDPVIRARMTPPLQADESVIARGLGHPTGHLPLALDPLRVAGSWRMVALGSAARV
jgi:hypothetical protein